MSNWPIIEISSGVGIIWAAPKVAPSPVAATRIVLICGFIDTNILIGFFLLPSLETAAKCHNGHPNDKLLILLI